MNWRDHIDRDPAVLGGKPKIQGTRLSVELILGRLGEGWTADQLIKAYPHLTAEQIQKEMPDWDLFEQGCPEGEIPSEVGERVDRVIRKIRAIGGDVALFSHGHLSRVFAIRWINLPVEDGHMFVLDTATLNVLGAYHDAPAIVTWNAKIDGYS